VQPKTAGLLFLGILPMTKSIYGSILTLALLLSACGGDSPPEKWKEGEFADADSYKNQCQSPRTGSSKITGIPFPDQKGSRLDEKNFLRSWSQETYLWYKELPDIDPANSDTPQVYFDKLKTSAKTSSGKAKDNFHFSEPTEDSEAWEAGMTYGYGLHLKVYSTIPPRSFFVSDVEVGSPAANAGIKRGDQILELDNVSLISDNTTAGINTLNGALFPDALNEAHSFTLQHTGETTSYTVTLVSAEVDVTAVPVAKVITQGEDKIGYIQFNTFIENAQDEWVDAVQDLKDAGVSDLVLDLRYNGGGLISIASMVSYMIGGSNVAGKTFIQYVANDQYAADQPYSFSVNGIYGVNNNVALPSFNFNRVYILTTSGTCSASELIVNSLRGAGVEVFLIGDSTCGKPYGFTPEDNCGTTYYTIQFTGINAKGFGEYSDGFVPSNTDNGLDLVRGCEVTDDITHALGDPDEAVLSTALNFRTTGLCAITGSGVSKLQKNQGPVVDGQLIRSSREEISIFDLSR
jgi:carboxyl-terminal processing protease